MTSNMKKCPFCAEEILAEAKKCKHCQSSFDAPVSEMVQKKVTVQGALTEKGRKTNLTKASKKWEAKGWAVVEAFDGGLTGASYLLLEIEKGQAPSEINKKAIALGAVAIIIILSIFSSLISEQVAENDLKKELANLDIDAIKAKDLKWYKSLSINNRKSLISRVVSDSAWDVKATGNYYKCMGDFAGNKSEDLNLVEVLEWCNYEYKNQRDVFNAHFNELDAVDLSSESKIMCETLVTNSLKSPSSAEFPLSANIRSRGKQKYYVASYVDSQNSFGATTRTKWFCTVTFIGNDASKWTNLTNWKVNSLTFE